MASKITDTRRFETDRFYLNVSYNLAGDETEIFYSIDFLGANQFNKNSLIELRDLITEAVEFTAAIRTKQKQHQVTGNKQLPPSGQA